jgi:sulfite reductase alpha subunit-like flavoprotein
VSAVPSTLAASAGSANPSDTTLTKKEKTKEEKETPTDKIKKKKKANLYGSRSLLDAGSTTVKLPSGATLESLYIIYATNGGTCSDLAEQLTEQLRGVLPSTIPIKVGGVDDIIFEDKADKEGWAAEGRLTLFIVSTYNGKCPDNAVKMDDTLQSGGAKSLKANCTYSVFGVSLSF